MQSLVEVMIHAHKDEPKRDLAPDTRTPEQTKMLLLLETSLKSLQEQLKENLTQKQANVLIKLSKALEKYINTKGDEEEAYRTFKDLVNVLYLPELKLIADKEKHDKQTSLIYLIHYGAVAVFRALFYLFDVFIAAGKTVITGAKFRLKSETPGYQPFFKYPEVETLSSKRIATLSKEFEETIESLDNLKNIPERNANSWRNSAN